MPVSFVLTDDELNHHEGPDAHRGIEFGIETLTVPFTTTPAFVAEVLPPCFSAAPEPTGSVVCANYRRSDGPGRPMVEFEMTAIYLDASYQGIPGLYSLVMLISDDMPVTTGREMLGEIKKHGETRIYGAGSVIYAYGERKGVRIVQVEADLGPDLGPSAAEYYGLELKACPTADLRGFDVPPTVVVMRNQDDYAVTRVGSAAITLSPNGYDPVESIPINAVGQATYSAGRSTFVLDSWAPIAGAGTEYMPIVLGRQYDFPRFA